MLHTNYSRRKLKGRSNLCDKIFMSIVDFISRDVDVHDQSKTREYSFLAKFGQQIQINVIINARRLRSAGWQRVMYSYNQRHKIIRSSLSSMQRFSY